MSEREWQLKLGGSQWGVVNLYDGLAPMDPEIVSSYIIKIPSVEH